MLVRPECTRLAEHGIDEGGLAMVDMGNDGHVADVVSGLHTATLLPAGRPSGRFVVDLPRCQGVPSVPEGLCQKALCQRRKGTAPTAAARSTP